MGREEKEEKEKQEEEEDGKGRPRKTATGVLALHGGSSIRLRHGATGLNSILLSGFERKKL